MATSQERSSYEKINYKIRPAKSIERKMLCESFHKLTFFTPIYNYRYIGFGSPFFADFTLFHKQLGINKMISIEKDIENEPRFTFNKPYKCIDMMFGDSHEQLPEVNWDESRNIVWLDYDGHMTKNTFEDIQTVLFNTPSGSVFIISINVHLRKGQEVSLLKKCLEDKTPEGLTNSDLEFWKSAEVFKDIINNNIKEVLESRNKTESDKFNFEQLYYLGYADGAKMLTYGGVIFQESEKHLFESCNFNDLRFINKSNIINIIDVPSLTYKEVRHLDSQLPHEVLSEIAAPGVKREDVEKYSKLYKLFPSFSETEI
ncbi:O-methyltransferase [Paenibacillus illinoisensis]|uniref:O-methyltransferase n=1 Tax=Paenibacillus illinoisensis TaxID=59845 RepID=A0ABW8HT55_9BACL